MYGVLSLIVWALILVVSVKYIVFILRADNRGEGGILALLALVLQRQHRDRATGAAATVLVSLGLFGAALLYGDGIITPAISVLGAVEGLEVATPALRARSSCRSRSSSCSRCSGPAVRHGAASARAFGPVMLALVRHHRRARRCARSSRDAARSSPRCNPWYGVRFFARARLAGFLVLGAVVLAVTGGEALYADMGHFGKRPIRIAWFALVLPALLLNYFGQGALLLRDPGGGRAIRSTCSRRAGRCYPLLVIATLAAIIASQALISGAFSLTQQACSSATRRA